MIFRTKRLCRLSLTLVFALLSAGRAFSQQITKFGVVDTGRVYQAYFRNSAPVRNYESKKEEFQKEVNRLTEEIQKLHDRRLEMRKKGDEAGALRIDSQITQKTDYLNAYASAKNVELESLKKSLQSNDSFYKKLYETLGRIAETGGYSMILSLQQDNSILWYSSSVDITDEVIAQLGL